MPAEKGDSKGAHRALVQEMGLWDREVPAGEGLPSQWGAPELEGCGELQGCRQEEPEV